MPAPVLGDEFIVHVETSNRQQGPQVTQLADGRVLVTWMSYDADVDGDEYGISARVGTVQADGSIVWSAAGEFTVNVGAEGLQTWPQVTVLSDGRVLFAWENETIEPGINARIGTVQIDGSIAWGAAGELNVNEEFQGPQQRPQVIALSDGRVLFTWESFDPDVDGDQSGVSARIGTVQPDGSIIWGSAGEFTVNQVSGSWQADSQVIALDDGRVVFTWTSWIPGADDAQISARIGTVQSDGSIVWAAGGEFTVNEEAQDRQREPQLTVLSDGRVLFTWQSLDPDVDGSAWGISARIGTVEADGSFTWDTAGEFTVNEEVQNNQHSPQVTVLSDGRVLFTWPSNDPDVDGNAYGVSARVGVVQSDGSIVWEGGEFTVNAGAQGWQHQVQVIQLADGRLLFTWTSDSVANDPDGEGIVGRVLTLNTPPLARDDSIVVAENGAILGGNLFADNGAGIDDPVDGDTLTITAVNGSASNVGVQITLASGALLTVNANGSFDYDPNGAFGPTYGAQAFDSFTYTIGDGFGGAATAAVSVFISSAGELIIGDELGNELNGGLYGDFIAAQAGDDVANGGSGDDTLDGEAGDDTLNGEAGGDWLYGRADNDTLNGGVGRDSLFGGDGADALNGEADNDTLEGGAGDDVLNGGDGADVLRGRANDDTLDGGAGADFMFGGAGDDVFYVDHSGDEVGELSASGTDTVIASINYVLPFYVENLTLTGAAANGAGNVLANTIIGTSANNTLQGLGGADTIIAGGGSDTIFGGDGNDDIGGGQGDDIIDGGNHRDFISGEDGDDIVYGRQDNDSLGGAAGADTLYGGDGDDDLYGFTGNDFLDGGNGGDRLQGQDENDTLFGRQGADTLDGGADNDTLYGGDDGDLLYGGAGADALFGGNGWDLLDGGAGADVLNGGTGLDTFVFSTALGSGNIDTIVGFNVADDRIDLSVAIFTGIGVGALAANAFVIGSAATTADHRIIYDATTGALFYDADGNGAGAAVRFATLATGLALTESDFFGGP